MFEMAIRQTGRKGDWPGIYFRADFYADDIQRIKDFAAKVFGYRLLL